MGQRYVIFRTCHPSAGEKLKLRFSGCVCVEGHLYKVIIGSLFLSGYDGLVDGGIEVANEVSNAGG
jgi:hypothetical protein